MRANDVVSRMPPQTGDDFQYDSENEDDEEISSGEGPSASTEMTKWFIPTK